MSARFLDGRITVSVHPFFLVMAGLLGVSAGRTPRSMALWAAAVAVSVLVHELGHAAVCLLSGTGADVTLHGFGGSTRPRDPSIFGTWRTALLDLAGCGAGFLLAGAALAALAAHGAKRIELSVPALAAASALFQVNAWFSLFNLLPVAPMDGGKLVQGLLGARFGIAGRRAGHAFGAVLGALVALWFLADGALYGALLCGALAAGEGRSFARALRMTAADADESMRLELSRTAELWAAGKKDEATAALTSLREKTGAGLVHSAATLQLAVFSYMQSRFDEAYALFKESEEGDMSSAARRAYADAARRKGDYALALRLGRTNFHDQPGPQTAAAAAIAAAGLRDARETVSWLRTAIRLGLSPAEARAPDFDPVRGTDEFRDFLAGLESR